MPLTVLIQEPDALIGLDVAQTVVEAWPSAKVTLCRSTEAARTHLAQGLLPQVMIMRQSLSTMRLSGLGTLADRIGSRVHLTAAVASEDQATRRSGWTSLEMPFTTAQLLVALLEAPSQAPSVQTERHSGFA